MILVAADVRLTEYLDCPVRHRLAASPHRVDCKMQIAALSLTNPITALELCPNCLERLVSSEHLPLSLYHRLVLLPPHHSLIAQIDCRRSPHLSAAKAEVCPCLKSLLAPVREDLDPSLARNLTLPLTPRDDTYYWLRSWCYLRTAGPWTCCVERNVGNDADKLLLNLWLLIVSRHR